MPAVGLHQAQVATFKFKVGTGYGEVTGTAGAKTMFGVGNGNADGTLPDNALVTRAWIESVTLPVGVGATVKLGVTGNDDLFVAATAITDGMFVVDAVTALTKEIPAKLAADVHVLATVATATLTAGEFYVHVEYVPGE
jgi:hypothetical protein